MRFCHLTVPEAVLAERLAARRGHYTPASLLRSQLQTLEELQPDEPGFRVPEQPTPEDVVAEVLRRL